MKLITDTFLVAWAIGTIVINLGIAYAGYRLFEYAEGKGYYGTQNK